MDGTLVDTEPYWIDAEFALAEQHGGTWSREHALNLVGNDLLDSGALHPRAHGHRPDAGEIVEELLDGVVAQVEEEVPWRPGARRAARRGLRRPACPCALVTMSYRRFVAPILAELPDGTFAAVVTGDAVEPRQAAPRAVPHGRRLLGVHPEDCLAIEDSNPGATSAVAAGCLVLVVPNHVPVRPGSAVSSATRSPGSDLADLRQPGPSA